MSQLILSPIEGTIRDNTAVWDQACAGGKISSESMEKKNDIATIYARPQLLKWNGYETRWTPRLTFFLAFLDVTAHNVQ